MFHSILNYLIKNPVAGRKRTFLGKSERVQIQMRLHVSSPYQTPRVPPLATQFRVSSIRIVSFAAFCLSPAEQAKQEQEAFTRFCLSVLCHA